MKSFLGKDEPLRGGAEVDEGGESVGNPVSIIDEGRIGRIFESSTFIAIVLIHSNQIRGETMGCRMGANADRMIAKVTLGENDAQIPRSRVCETISRLEMTFGDDFETTESHWEPALEIAVADEKAKIFEKFWGSYRVHF